MYEVRIHGLFDDAESNAFDVPGQPGAIIRNGLARCVRSRGSYPAMACSVRRNPRQYDYRPADIH
jgi:hypothetical protein